MKIYLLGLLLIVCTLCTGCAEHYNHAGKTPLVEVNGSFLYQEDLQSALPVPISYDDSVLFAEHYIRSWIENILLNKKAESNIPNSKEINRLVDNYKKSLITHAYQQELINQKLSKNIPEDELLAYYESNKELFKLDRPLIKGLFIKVPLTAPRLNDLRKWYKSETPDALDNLEKYRIQNAVKYEYFYDRWVPISEILDLIPLNVDSVEAYVDKTRQIELKDSAFHYFLNVTDFRRKGEEEPFEFARTDASDMLVNLKQVDFIKQVKDDLYRQAIKQNKIKYNY